MCIRDSGCITCALCIDACDTVMGQIGKPRGLIDYCTLDDADIEKAGGQSAPLLKTIFRPRTLIYFGLWSSIGVAMLFALGQRTRLDLNVQHDRNPVFVQLSDGSIRNNYMVKVRNMETRPRDVELLITGLPGAVVWTADTDRVDGRSTVDLRVAPDSITKVLLFVAAPAKGEEHTEFAITVKAKSGQEKGDSDEVVFERPEGSDHHEGDDE
jgi:polyferredoxin